MAMTQLDQAKVGRPPEGAGPPAAELWRAPRAADIAARLDRRTVSQPVLSGLVRGADAFLAVVIGTAAAVATHAPLPPLALLPLGGAPLALLLFAQAADGYEVGALGRFARGFGIAAAAWTALFVIFVVALALLAPGDSEWRSWFGAWYVAGLGGLAVLRAALALLVRRWTAAGRLERRAILVGGGTAAAELIERLEATPENDVRIWGVFDDRGDERSPPVVAGYPKLGTVAELVDFARRAKIDMLLITLPLTAERRVQEILKQLWVLPVDIRLAAHTDKLGFRSRGSRLGTVPVVNVADRPIADWNALTKRGFDLAVGSLALLALSPLMALVALAIKLDTPGPVLFRQKRWGFNNEVIGVFKFRSMHHAQRDEAAKKAVTRGDPRVTRVGRFIRKTSIDELPQLFNVVRGELSLVGPRPHALHSNTNDQTWEQVVDGYFARHRVKPGVTGWAQINGWRGEVDDPEKLRQRVAHDLYYIENWSILFDVLILLKTPLALAKAENAF
ncbi:MAG TPA: undecaprenyl-phosphate glucose phosphotransferase [Hyphomicrobiales bacterium]|nr:undecaprenyl-phosphate glucose phosphotransferase [Hyphomicrobiales bacterium]